MPAHCAASVSSQDIRLDLPVPPSVNRTRRINWAGHAAVKRWLKAADALTTAAWAGGNRPKHVIERFEILLTLDEAQAGADLDNVMKVPIDYLKRLGLIIDDSGKYMRRIVVEWGHAPHGARLILSPHRPCEQVSRSVTG
jgi:hypothetical protein